MKTSADGIIVMHAFEGCRLAAYPDPATGGKPWTIGWGTTGPGIGPGMVITQQQADQMFADRLTREFEPGVEDALQNEPTQRQFDAMVSLAYNIGLANFRGSSALRFFNLLRPETAADWFLPWNKANGQVMLGLKRRRAAERALFLGKSAAEAVAIGKAVMA
ncbi:glycoside hydrolase family protein [Xylophilus rhododendri]|uniref:Lysozyme n=1 Tax=Xylophilus rhododendri TaxID=2697032 RepID=A0A857JAQ9_9BURK|nr:lysozyme [Xylophilus rhododendri]QHJ00130.1 glycoside hydrolase family protein [Xylophilus rhododendri]